MIEITIHAKPSTWKHIENALICFSPIKPTQNICQIVHTDKHIKFDYFYNFLLRRFSFPATLSSGLSHAKQNIWFYSDTYKCMLLLNGML